MTILDIDDVRRALAAPDDEITAEQLAVLRAAAEGYLAHEAALERAVVELSAFAARCRNDNGQITEQHLSRRRC